jgi:hypothetical protein
MTELRKWLKWQRKLFRNSPDKYYFEYYRGAFQITAPCKPVGGHSDPYRNANGMICRCWSLTVPLLVADQQRQFDTILNITGDKKFSLFYGIIYNYS